MTRRAAPQRGGSLRSRRGTVLLELAVIAPLMLILVLGTWDFANGLIVREEAGNASEWIAFSAQSLAVQNDQTTALTPAQATLAMTAIYGAMPRLKTGGLPGHYAVTLSAVNFTPSAGTAPRARLAWRVPLREGNDAIVEKLRACDAGALREVAAWPQTDANLRVIATGRIARPGTVAVADVYYQYVPLFLGFLTGPIDFYASTQLPNLTPRNDQPLRYDPGNPRNPDRCQAT
jgi:Flp pilus assembly protein TadG